MSLLVILPMGFVGILIYGVAAQDIAKLIVCAHGACYSPFSEFAEWYLFHFRGTPEDLNDLDKSTGLSFVIRDEELLRFFIKKGVPINKVDYQGFTPLHAAIIQNLPGSVKILLEHGADPNLKDSGGRTALEVGKLMKNNLTPTDAIKVLEEFKTSEIK